MLRVFSVMFDVKTFIVRVTDRVTDGIGAALFHRWQDVFEKELCFSDPKGYVITEQSTAAGGFGFNAHLYQNPLEQAASYQSKTSLCLAAKGGFLSLSGMGPVSVRAY